MTMLERSRVVPVRVEGFRGWSLQDERLRVVVVPELGAKIVELTDLVNGRQWLAEGVRPLAAVHSARRWQDGPCSGWDECFPNIAPGPHPTSGMDLDDHGEAWSAPWRAELSRGCVLTTLRLDTVPLTVARRLRLDADGLRCDYVVRNRSGAATAFGWAMHLLIAATPGLEVLAPLGSGLRVDSAFGADLVDGPWPPVDPGGRRLSLMGASPGTAAKLYLRTHGATGLVARDGDAWLGLLWEASEIPHAGIWLNQGGWPAEAPQHHVGLEPSIGARDELGAAWADGSAGVLEGRGARRWSVRVQVGRAASRELDELLEGVA